MNQKIIDFNIKKLDENDLKTLTGWAVDEKTMIQWCGPVFDFPLTVKQLLPWFSETKKNEPYREIFKAVTNEGKLIGICELGGIDRKNQLGALCRIFVDSDFRGKGISDKLLRFVINYAFNDINLRRLELNVYSFNTPAIICYQKLGFIREGLKRKVTQYKDEYWDGYVYGLLKEDWKGSAVNNTN